MNRPTFNDTADKALTEVYRNYHLETCVEGNTCIGQVFKNGCRLAYCESARLDLSLQHLRSIVDSNIEHKSRMRNTPPTSEELVEALLAIKPLLEPFYVRMLRFHYRSEGGRASLENLQEVAHCQSTTDVYIIYAHLARCLCDELAYAPPLPNNGRDPLLGVLLLPNEHYPAIEKSITLTLTPRLYGALQESQW